MPKQKLEYSCLLISPSDLEVERDAVENAISRWNAHIGAGLDALVRLVRWESDSRPDLSGQPQTVLNRQIVDGSDFGIALFWSRVGTPTENFVSGSIEEVEYLTGQGRQVLVYFCGRDVPQARLQDDQFRRLMDLKADLQKRGILNQFTTPEDLVTQITLHVSSVVIEQLIKARAHGGIFANSGSMTAPMPDVKVKTRFLLVKEIGGRGRTSPVIQISVQNRSPGPFYLSSVSLAPAGEGTCLAIMRDSVSKELVGPRQIASGDAFQLNVDPRDVNVEALERAVSFDRIEREFSSAPGELVAEFEKWRAWEEEQSDGL